MRRHQHDPSFLITQQEPLPDQVEGAVIVVDRPAA
jgi:hypothetical protein